MDLGQNCSDHYKDSGETEVNIGAKIKPIAGKARELFAILSNVVSCVSLFVIKIIPLVKYLILQYM